MRRRWPPRIPVPDRYLHEGAVRSGIAEYATATYLDVLGLRPSLGRWFDATEERPGAPLVAVLGHQAWTRVFRADPSVVGRVVRIEGVPVTIVGIGPANHRGTLDVGLVTDFWLPITALRQLNPMPAGRDASTILAPLFVKARLREGATVAQAKAAMDVLARRLAAEHSRAVSREGEFALGTGITVVPTTDVRIHPQADVPIMALASLVLVIVSLVLAIACSNLATLLLVRGAARAKEVSVRLAMGAKRPQLVRHLLIESLLLSLGGRHRRLHPGVVGHAGAARGRAPRHSGSDARLPRARLCDRAVAGHGRGVRPGAGAQGHAGSTFCRHCATRGCSRSIIGGSR